MTHWHSLYLSSDHFPTINNLISRFFDAMDYSIYNPFYGLPGMSYPQAFKLFVAPSSNGWTRIVLDSDTNLEELPVLIDALSLECDVLDVMLDGNIATIHGYRDMTLLDIAAWAQPHLKTPDINIDNLLNVEEFNLPPLSAGDVGGIALENLPPDVQAMAQDVDAEDANSMFQKLSKRLMKTVGFQSVRDVVAQQPNWDSQGGQYIRTLMQHLTIENDWRTPDFATLRSAYALKQQQGSLSQADQDMIDSVPSVDSYMPFYGGRFENNVY